MANKVSGVGTGPAPAAATQPVRKATDAAVGDGKAAAAQPTASVSITDSARQLAALEQAVKSMPAVNETKVAAIRKSIQDGTYQVEPEKIADKLLQMEQSLYVASPTGK